MKYSKFKELRQEQGKTQRALAKDLGITKDYVNMIENGRRTPGFALAKRIADLFEVTVDELFFYSANERVIRSNTAEADFREETSLWKSQQRS